MKTIFLIFTLNLIQNMYTLYNAGDDSNSNSWKIVNDVVMGGLSESSVVLDESGIISFEGHVSLENNGGFAMCQYYFDMVEMSNYSKFSLKLKGDGNIYQFRVKANIEDSHSYISSFETTGQWQTIEIPFKEMYPSFRGKRLDIENFPGKQAEMIAFLIGNKKEQDFELKIESIELY